MKTQMHMLLEAVRCKNKDLAYEWKNTDTWITLEHLLEANSPSMGFVSIHHDIKNYILWYHINDFIKQLFHMQAR